MVRDNLEYGRYDPKGKLTLLQYLTQKILEFKQLTPVVPQKLLVRKLSKYFGCNIQIAAITHGITNVTMQANVLSEYEYITERTFQDEVTRESSHNECWEQIWQ